MIHEKYSLSTVEMPSMALPGTAACQSYRFVSLRHVRGMHAYCHMRAEECDYLRAKAEPRLHPSAVTDFKRPGAPQTTINQGRTSTGTFFARQEDDVIAGIEQRIATWTMVAPENSEGMQVLRYQVQD